MSLKKEEGKDLMLDRKFFSKNAANIVARYRKHIFDPTGGGKKAKQVTGRPYPDYSKKGENVGWRTIGEGTNRRSVFIDSYKNKKLKKGDSKFAQSNAPVFTRALMNDFQGFQLISGGFRFGTPTQSGKVKNLAKLGRVISSERKPLPDSVSKYIMIQADKYVKKKLGKIKGGRFNI
tara:strand:- start:242 stop:772 length:531 start_codon:yes stop_codon:yes gene_type:complete